MAERPYFSIVVPAHDEEGYLGNTLEHLANLTYPAESYETIVVENGSSDRTLEIARRFESANVRVFSNAVAGVSAAKNYGIDRMASHGDWVVFLDADTVLKEGFLTDLERLVADGSERLAIGTTTVRPLEDGRRAAAWFAYYDLAHRWGKGSYSIQIARRSMFPDVRFDESLVIGEDLMLIKNALEVGEFFFLRTPTVYTSTRRFEAIGYWRLFFRWTIVAILPAGVKKAFGYDVIR